MVVGFIFTGQLGCAQTQQAEIDHLHRPGQLLELDFERTFTPQQIDSFIAPLFAGFTQPQALYSVDVYQAVISSTYPDGSPARAYVQVFLPQIPPQDVANQSALQSSPRSTQRPNPQELLPLYVFGPGSTGLLDVCRPSREHEAGIRWGLYRAHVLSHAGQGMAGMIPDYLGFRDPERYQYYMVAQAEAAVMLDSIRAFSSIRQELGFLLGEQTFNVVTGFSQGGHAAFAAGDFNQLYAPDIRVHGIIGFGPTTDPMQLMLQFPSVAPMIIFTYGQLYGEHIFDPLALLQGEFGEFLADDVLSQCVGGMQSTFPSRADHLFTPEFYRSLSEGTLDRDFPLVAFYLRLNSTGLRIRDIPVLILQGTDDIVIFEPTQRVFVERLILQGVDVDYRVIEGQRHDTRQAGFQATQDWIWDLASSFSQP